MKYNTVLLIWLCLVLCCTGCRKTWVEQDAREHSQFIMNNLFADTILTMFPEKYFSRSEVENILEQLEMRCDPKTRVGGFEKSTYMSIINGPDQVVFTYYYMFNCDELWFDLHYLIYSNSFELRHVKVRNRTDMERDGAL